MVDAAKHTYTAGMDDTFVATFAPKARERLGTEAGNTLMGGLHIALRVERRLEKHNPSGKERRRMDSALRSWSEEFLAAVRCIEEPTTGAVGRGRRHAELALDHARAASAAGHRAGIYKQEPQPAVHVAVTEEDMLLANAGLQDYVDMLDEIEYGTRYGAND